MTSTTLLRLAACRSLCVCLVPVCMPLRCLPRVFLAYGHMPGVFLKLSLPACGTPCKAQHQRMVSCRHCNAHVCILPGFSYRQVSSQRARDIVGSGDVCGVPSVWVGGCRHTWRKGRTLVLCTCSVLPSHACTRQRHCTASRGVACTPPLSHLHTPTRRCGNAALMPCLSCTAVHA